LAKVEPFDKHTQEYDSWFERNRFAYLSELQAVREQLPSQGDRVEIGVGTGRFAVPLGVDFGVEPSQNMCLIARERGVMAVRGLGEALPFSDSEFDAALMVTTLCFLDDTGKGFAEAYRILKKGGCFVVGFIDKDSLLGRLYQRQAAESPFYRVAQFYSADEVMRFMTKARFRDLTSVQTIFHELPEITEVEPVESGYGRGSFVVVKGIK
jgi:ubiquinone/menaquinone biosynthesis C-methylase UbiE